MSNKDPFGVSKIAPRIVYHGTSRTRAGKIATEGLKRGKGGYFGPAVYTSVDPQEANKWGAFKAWKDKDSRRVRRYRLMAVGPSKELPESKISAYQPNQLINDGPALGTKVRAGNRWDKTMRGLPKRKMSTVKGKKKLP